VTATRILTGDDVRALRAVAARFGEGGAARKAALVAAAARRDVGDADTLIAWHDCLLFQIAYPESAAQLSAARAGLARVAGVARRIAAEGPARERRRLEGSGLAWTGSTFAFGWDVARWLAARFPRQCDIDSFGDDGAPLADVLAAALPPLEFALLADAEDPILFLDAVRGRATRLAWLVAQLERLPCTDSVRAPLWDALRAFVALRPGASALARTFVRGLPGPAFIHGDGLARDLDVPALLRRPLPRARRLGKPDRAHAIDAARAMLAALGRETDAIALTHPAGVEWHEVGRGVAVALYAMRPERGDALDAHVGMMLFKNGVPVGYGGGWPFAGTCRIGVNVFAPFRGGESALLFAQVMRVFRRRFRVERFVVEPSQFGGDNLEGLRSGAFWFYWRLGFRPVDPVAAMRARAEHARMQAEPGYRTPIASLRKFTDSDVELMLADAHPPCEPAHLSAAVTAWIEARFGGNRTAAEAAAVRAVAGALRVAGLRAWPAPERRAFAVLAPLLALIPDLARWSATERRRVTELVRAKGRDEYRFQRLLARHGRLRAAFAALAANQG
jgi:hypothetical protein